MVVVVADRVEGVERGVRGVAWCEERVLEVVEVVVVVGVVSGVLGGLRIVKMEERGE